MITSIIRQALGTVSPRALAILRAVRSRRRSTRFERTVGATGAAQKIADNVGLEVQRGPFRGMHFPATLRQRGIGSKLLGTYEHELYDFVAGAIAHAPDRVFVVGSAEGYYAVGLARALPKAEVTAFDIDPWARARCCEMARLNGVDTRLTARSFCATEDLLPLRGVHALVISDCEGFEYELFTSSVIEAMDRSIVIIETHPYVDGGDNVALVRAFERTHSIQMIASEPGNRLSREEYAPYLREEEFARAVDEYRPAAQQWLCATPLPARLIHE